MWNECDDSRAFRPVCAVNALGAKELQLPSQAPASMNDVSAAPKLGQPPDWRHPNSFSREKTRSSFIRSQQRSTASSLIILHAGETLCSKPYRTQAENQILRLTPAWCSQRLLVKQNHSAPRVGRHRRDPSLRWKQLPKAEPEPCLRQALFQKVTHRVRTGTCSSATLPSVVRSGERTLAFCRSLFNTTSARALYQILNIQLNTEDENQSFLIASSTGWE